MANLRFFITFEIKKMEKEIEENIFEKLTGDMKYEIVATG